MSPLWWLTVFVPLFACSLYFIAVGLKRRRPPKVLAQTIYMYRSETWSGATLWSLRAEGRISDLPWPLEFGGKTIGREILVGWNGHWATCILTSFTFPGRYEGDDFNSLDIRLEDVRSDAPVRGDWTAELKSAWIARNRVDLP